MKAIVGVAPATRGAGHDKIKRSMTKSAHISIATQKIRLALQAIAGALKSA